MACGWYLEGLCRCQIHIGASVALFRKPSLHSDPWDWRTVPLKWGGQQVWEIPNYLTFFVFLSSGHLWGLLCSILDVSVFRWVEIVPHPLQMSFFPSSFSLRIFMFWMFLLMATCPYFMEALLFHPWKIGRCICLIQTLFLSNLFCSLFWLRSSVGNFPQCLLVPCLVCLSH